jgi:hypothetical protein
VHLEVVQNPFHRPKRYASIDGDVLFSEQRGQPDHNPMHCHWNIAAMGHSPLSALLEKIDSPKIVNFDVSQ